MPFLSHSEPTQKHLTTIVVTTKQAYPLNCQLNADMMNFTLNSIAQTYSRSIDLHKNNIFDQLQVRVLTRTQCSQHHLMLTNINM